MTVLVGGILTGFVIFLGLGYAHSPGWAAFFGFFWYVIVAYYLFYAPAALRLAKFMSMPLFALPIAAFVIGYLAHYERTETFRIRVGLE